MSNGITCKIEDIPTGTTFCQTISQGQKAKFVAKDGNQGGCGANATSTVVAVPSTLSSLAANCYAPQPNDDPACSCVNGKQDNECNWEVAVPSTPCQNVEVSSR